MSHKDNKETDHRAQKEQYVRLATRGLWGRRRLEVKEELMTHIEDRTTVHRIAGMREGDALERTLQELGHPREVREGMVQLYTLPTLLGSGALLASVCAVLVVLFSSSLAQTLSTTDRFPSAFCFETQYSVDAPSPFCYPGLWTNVEALKDVLEPQGVGVSYGDFVLKLAFSDGSQAKSVNLNLYTRFFLNENMAEFPAEYQARPGYVPVWGLLEQIILGSDVEVEIKGWPNPRIALNGASFELGTKGGSEGRELYQTYLSDVLFDSLVSPASAYQVYVLSTPPSFGPTVDENLLHTQRFDLAARTQDVYGVIVVIKGPESLLPGAAPYREDELTFFTNVAPADADGTVALQLPKEPVTFVDKLPVQPEVGTAILVRLTGEASEGSFGYEIVSPERLR